MRSIATLALAALVSVPAAARADGPLESPDGLDAAAASASSQKRGGVLLALLSGAGVAAGGILIYRGVTACERWRADENNEEQYLCFGAEMGYIFSGGLLAISGAIGVGAGLLAYWRGSRRLEAIERERRSLELSVVLQSDGVAAGLSMRF